MLKNLIGKTCSVSSLSKIKKNSILIDQLNTITQMRKIHKFTTEELTTELSKIPSWELAQETNRNVIRKNFVFKDFKQAWTFMNKVAEKADAVSISIVIPIIAE